MFLKKIVINNYRLFDENFKICDLNVPDKNNAGSGLNLIVGENGCGKTAILDAIALSMLEYKGETFNINDFNDINKSVDIFFYADEEFAVKGVMPNSTFQALGFNFTAKLRTKTQKNYLVSPLVYDQLYIRKNPNRPKDGSPDLRLSVNNPFSGKRFHDTDILYLDKNRLFQTRSGTFNNTRFDRLMDDFNFQYIKNTDIIEDLNIELNDKIKKDKIENTFLEDAIRDFESISGYKIWLDFIDNYRPFKNSLFVVKGNNNSQIPLASIGSGFEMMFSLIYSYYLAKQNGRNLIILIDEPELHLHPDIQEKFVKFLLEASKDFQIILTTHSPILVKQIMHNDNIKSIIINKNHTYSSIKNRKLSYLSSNEINYIAFNLATEEYHNELYEEIKEAHGSSDSYKDFDNNYFINIKGEDKICPWKGNTNEVSLHTYVRNQIHHRKDNGEVTYENLKKSIDFMRNCLWLEHKKLIHSAYINSIIKKYRI